MIDIRQQHDALGSGDKALLPGHIEAWAPALLLELIGYGPGGLSGQGKVWAQWARQRFNPDSYRGAGSWNWQHMIAACLLWLDPAMQISFLGRTMTILDWWSQFLAAQAGKLDLGEPIFRRFGGTETLSSTYEPFRFGPIESARLLALRFPENSGSPEILSGSRDYNQILTALLALGAAPWWDRDGHANAKGQPYYDGPTVSPVGERSTPAHAYQSDLGPFLALAADFPLTVSKREEWPMDICRQVAARDQGLGIDPALATACRALVNNESGAVSSVVDALSGVTLFSRMEWIRYQEGVLVLSGPRLNLNTPKIFWSFADNATQKMQIGFPWQGGQHRGKGASTAAGSVEITKDADGKPYVIAKAEEGHDASYALPTSPPIYHVIGDAAGIRSV